jgi:hypothetical protein
MFPISAKMILNVIFAHNLVKIKTLQSQLSRSPLLRSRRQLIPISCWAKNKSIDRTIAGE